MTHIYSFFSLGNYICSACSITILICSKTLWFYTVYRKLKHNISKNNNYINFNNSLTIIDVSFIQNPIVITNKFLAKIKFHFSVIGKLDVGIEAHGYGECSLKSRKMNISQK